MSGDSTAMKIKSLPAPQNDPHPIILKVNWSQANGREVGLKEARTRRKQRKLLRLLLLLFPLFGI